MIEGIEIVLLILYVITATVGLVMVVYRLGDHLVSRRSGTNNDREAVDMYVDLIGKSKRKLWIRDDGNDSENTVYNNERVLQALKSQFINHPKLEVRCLFNDRKPLLGVREVANENPRVVIRYTNDERPPNQLHYKIVDEGKILHLSTHVHGAEERGYVVRKPPIWAIGTRRRISAVYREEFEDLWQEADS